MGMFDSTRRYWAEQAGQQAEAQIAKRDQEFQRWLTFAQLELEYYEMGGHTSLAEEYRARIEYCTELHATRISLIEQAAAQQIADIHADYDAKDRDYDQSRAPWPTSAPAPAWDAGYTPAPAYGPRNGSDQPSPYAAPDMSGLAAPDEPEQEVSLIDRLFSLFS